MVSVAYHRDLREVQGDPALAALLCAPRQAAPFDRLEWWRGLEDHCALRPIIAVARDASGILVLPLMEDAQSLTGLANWYTFRLRPVTSSAADESRLLSALVLDLRRRTRRIVLSPLPGEDGSAARLAGAFQSGGWMTALIQSDTNRILTTNGQGFDAYLAARPGALRSTIRRKQPAVVTQILETFTADTWLEYEAVYRASWKPGEGSPAFLRSFAEQEAAAGRLRLGLARANGRTIAAQLWTVEAGTAFIHKLAHREDAKPLSPGTVLTAALLRHVMDIDRVRLVDFGTGDDPYKRDWMDETRPRYRLEALRLHPANAVPLGRMAAQRLVRALRHG